jgi:hypothetical protein
VLDRTGIAALSVALRGLRGVVRSGVAGRPGAEAR